MTAALLPLSYLLASILFIFAIRGLASPETARRGNVLGIIGMIIAVAATLCSPEVKEILWVLGAIAIGGIIGTVSALKVKMTSLPQMIAAFNGLGGLSAVFIALAEIIAGTDTWLESSLGLLIGAIAFSGSAVAFAKLQGLIKAKAILFPGQQLLNALLGLAVMP